MPRMRPGEYPKARLHKTGQYVVTLSGEDHYLGKDRSEVELRRAQVIAQWLANGRQPLKRKTASGAVTVGGLCDAYGQWARTYYIKRKSPDPQAPPQETSAVGRLAALLAALKLHYADMPASKFDVSHVHALREYWLSPRPGDRGRRVSPPMSRTGINRNVGEIARVFRWGAERKMVPVEVWHTLKAVSPLVRGKSRAAEPRPVVPPPAEHIRKAQEHLRASPRSKKIADMIEIQLLCGMRPSEVCGVRACDLVREGQVHVAGAVLAAGPVWFYLVPPHINKTEHADKPKVVAVGPRAQSFLSPYMEGKGKDRPLFAGRTGQAMQVCSYRESIARACAKAGVPVWKPNQLRHFRLTQVRAQYGLEAARVVGGHSDAAVTTQYAEADLAKAVQVAYETG